MDIAAERARIHRALTDAFEEAEATLQHADTGRVVYHDSGWTVKDLVAHVSAWEQEMLRSLQTYVDGSEYAVEGYTDDDTQNAKYYARDKDDSYEQVFSRWKDIRHQLISLVDQLTDAEMQGKMLYPWHQRGIPSGMLGSTVGHQNEHLAHIQRALRGEAHDIRAERVDILERTYQDSMGAIAGLDSEHVIHPASGWRVKDLMAHIAAWEEEIYRSFEAFHQGGEYTIPNYELESFNQRVYRERRERPYVQSIADWTKAREQVKSIMMAMTDRQMGAVVTYPWGACGDVGYLFASTLWHACGHIHEMVVLKASQMEGEAARIVRELDASMKEAFKALRPLNKEAVIYDESGWRVKDIVAHLYAWEKAEARALRAYRLGGAEPIADFTDVETFNQQQYEAHKELPFRWLVENWQLAREQIALQVIQMTPEQVAGEMTIASGRRAAARDLLIEDVIGHGRRHIADVTRKLGGSANAV